MLYDITRIVSGSLPVWPGDTPFTLTPVLRKVDGDTVNLTTIETTAHLGTHADAYYHFDDEGVSVDAMPLTAYIGPARVVSVSKEDGPLYPADFAHVDLKGVARLLIHSAVSDLDDEWPARFPYLSVALIDWLAGLGVQLVGLDSPSVDAFDSSDLPCHHALKRHNMVNLETLYLRDVPDGHYDLVALPLKLHGACGSPVRAILRTL